MANAVITGASRGIGFEFVKQLSVLPKISNVFAVCRNPTNAEPLQNLAEKQKNVKIIKGDMTDFSSYSRISGEIESHLNGGGIHMLVNNAGIMIRDTLETVTVKNITDTYEINTVAPLMFTKALLPVLKKADAQKSLVLTGKSVVVNISAQLGSIKENTTSGYVSYRLSKAALNMATKTLAIELKPLDIFVLALHPGWVKTDMGGPSAPVTVEDSVKSMLHNITAAEKKHLGCQLGHELRVIPW